MEICVDLWIIFQESGRPVCLSGQRVSRTLYYCCIRPRVRVNEVRLLSFLGDVEIGSSGEVSQIWVKDWADVGVRTVCIG